MPNDLSQSFCIYYLFRIMYVHLNAFWDTLIKNMKKKLVLMFPLLYLSLLEYLNLQINLRVYFVLL